MGNVLLEPDPPADVAGVSGMACRGCSMEAGRLDVSVFLEFGENRRVL